MRYESTRGAAERVGSADAIRRGLAPDGGLYVPSESAWLGRREVGDLVGAGYAQFARTVLGRYLDDYGPGEIAACVDAAYASAAFDSPEIAPLREYDGTAFILELWHGPTSAFKDMALQILPRLVTAALKKTRAARELVILVATSGDTGKAALEGFRDVPGTRVIVFYPEHGVSEMQRLQMVTQEGSNVHVFGVEGGDFDAAQAGVKTIFSDEAFAERLAAGGFELSSANSINWGRLAPQIVYYVSSYAELVRRGEIAVGDGVNVIVPTGNFGNILAAYYARAMGLPLGRLVCASNANRILTDFFGSGEYDRRRALRKTMSPSMDIVVSSNLERLLYELSDHDPAPVRRWMSELSSGGAYRVGEDIRAKADSVFWGASCGEEETLASIAKAWRERRVLVDPHTAVALDAYGKYRAATGDAAKTLIASTASPFKFNASVARAVLGENRMAGKDEFELLELLSSESGMAAPASLRGLRDRKARHAETCRAPAMAERVASALGL